MRFTFLILIFVFSLLYSFQAKAQFGKKYHDSTEVYFVNPYISAGLGTVGFALNFIGVERLRKNSPIEIDELLTLSAADVNSFDSYALRQGLKNRNQFSHNSDRWRDVGILLPMFLFIDKKARNQWLDIILMYAEVHAANGVAYAYSPLGPTFIERYRPIVYYDKLSVEIRASGRNRNSFYSGHVSTTAAGSFFAAKVLSDFHPEWGAKRIFLYVAAAIPPSLVGLYRVKSLNHFPTDSFVGLIVGAASGIIIPHLHKKRQGKLSLGLNYSDSAMFMSSSWKF